MIQDSVIPYRTVQIPAMSARSEATDVKENTEYIKILWCRKNNSAHISTEKKINSDVVIKVNGEIISRPWNHQHNNSLFLSDILPFVRPGRVKIDAVPFSKRVVFYIEDEPDLTVNDDPKLFPLMLGILMLTAFTADFKGKHECFYLLLTQLVGKRLNDGL